VADEGVDLEAHAHLSSAEHEGLASTAVLNNLKTEDGCADVNRSKNDGGNVGVGNTGCVEDGCAVVEEEVRSGQLLAGLQDYSEKRAVAYTWSSKDLILWVIATCELGLQLLFDFVNLRVDEW
jgi:hypothetical protein